MRGAIVPDQFQSGHRRSEPAAQWVRNGWRRGIGLGQVPALAPGDSGDAVFAHQARHPTSADVGVLAFEFVGVAFGAVWISVIQAISSESLSALSSRRASARTRAWCLLRAPTPGAYRPGDRADARTAVRAHRQTGTPIRANPATPENGRSTG
jgi:hypothetical protein